MEKNRKTGRYGKAERLCTTTSNTIACSVIAIAGLYWSIPFVFTEIIHLFITYESTFLTLKPGSGYVYLVIRYLPAWCEALGWRTHPHNNHQKYRRKTVIPLFTWEKGNKQCVMYSDT